ncbi:aminotransferase class I/II-fold pyridoxal phosphate-dependent enzyme [Streptomyces sp. NPDC021225]|uniref:aminotransferase class I/II-fold pyridoxal phosphate-dependent enzyme n=1 Tax=Streptomyces sp. NPDC021225 TaxID=3365121 RepID=UPI0037A2A5E6
MRSTTRSGTARGDSRSLAAVEPRLTDRVFLTNGVSKTYVMTGWRLGYGAGPADLVTAINTLQSQISSCPSSVSQAAAAAAFTGPQRFVAETVLAYRGRCDATVQLINEAPLLSCTPPDGGFYLLVDCADAIGLRTPDGARIENDEQFARHLLGSRQVAVIHGCAYGAPGYFRISFATSTDVLTESCARIAAACAALTPAVPASKALHD